MRPAATDVRMRCYHMMQVQAVAYRGRGTTSGEIRGVIDTPTHKNKHGHAHASTFVQASARSLRSACMFTTQRPRSRSRNAPSAPTGRPRCGLVSSPWASAAHAARRPAGRRRGRAELRARKTLERNALHGTGELWSGRDDGAHTIPHSNGRPGGTTRLVAATLCLLAVDLRLTPHLGASGRKNGLPVPRWSATRVRPKCSRASHRDKEWAKAILGTRKSQCRRAEDTVCSGFAAPTQNKRWLGANRRKRGTSQ